MNLPTTSPEKKGGKASYHNGTQNNLPIINLFPFTIPTLSFSMEHYIVKTGGRETFKSFPYREL